MSSDVTAIVNLHREGATCVPSLRSAIEATEAATQAGVKVELLVVLDDSDRRTAEVAEIVAGSAARTLSIAEGDLGAARNAGTAEASGRFVTFLDSDDLWGDQWISRSFAVATSAGTDSLVVWHPELTFLFGDDDISIYHHVASTDNSFDQDRFRMHNAWTALCFVERDALVEVPYRRNRLDVGLGFEDWAWNEEILRRGGSHQVVADTCHFVSRQDPERGLRGASRHAHRLPWRQGL